MFLTSFLSIALLGTTLNNPTTNKKDNVIDIYYPDSVRKEQLNLQDVDSPYTLNNCGTCDQYFIADEDGSRCDPVTTRHCYSERCKIYYLSRNDYDETKKWYNAKGLIFNYPRTSSEKVYRD